jgi:hypothetical protein
MCTRDDEGQGWLVELGAHVPYEIRHVFFV